MYGSMQATIAKGLLAAHSKDRACETTYIQLAIHGVGTYTEPHKWISTYVAQ
jgi:hypothetical protein